MPYPMYYFSCRENETNNALIILILLMYCNVTFERTTSFSIFNFFIVYCAITSYRRWNNSITYETNIHYYIIRM